MLVQKYAMKTESKPVESVDSELAVWKTKHSFSHAGIVKSCNVQTYWLNMHSMAVEAWHLCKPHHHVSILKLEHTMQPPVMLQNTPAIQQIMRCHASRCSTYDRQEKTWSSYEGMLTWHVSCSITIRVNVVEWLEISEAHDTSLSISSWQISRSMISHIPCSSSKPARRAVIVRMCSVVMTSPAFRFSAAIALVMLFLMRAAEEASAWDDTICMRHCVAALMLNWHRGHTSCSASKPTWAFLRKAWLINSSMKSQDTGAENAACNWCCCHDVGTNPWISMHHILHTVHEWHEMLLECRHLGYIRDCVVPFSILKLRSKKWLYNEDKSQWIKRVDVVSEMSHTGQLVAQQQHCGAMNMGRSCKVSQTDWNTSKNNIMTLTSMQQMMQPLFLATPQPTKMYSLWKNQCIKATPAASPNPREKCLTGINY